MPRRYKKNRRPRRAGWGKTARHIYKDAVSVGKAAYKGYQLAKTAIGLINAEHKYVDVNQSAVTIPNGGTFTLLSGLS